MFYNARWYDPSLGRFNQPDTIIPEQSQGVQAWDRYAYTNNNPVRYNDPTGHCPLCLTAVIGGAVGGIVGAVGYTAYIATTGREFNSTHFWMTTGGGALAGALIGTGVGIAAGVSVGGATTAAVEAGTVVEGANLACGGDMCASELQDASTAIQTANQICGGDMCASEVKDGTQQITTVVGRYPANKELAESIGANWLNIQDDVWKAMSNPERWARNKQWLQEAVIRGDVFRLASPISEAVRGSWYAKELDYLSKLGYTITSNQQYLIPK